MTEAKATTELRENTLLKIEALLIICQEPAAACGRLRSLGKEEIVFSVRSNKTVAERFSAGFRWGADFILFDELEKTEEDNGGREKVIRARIRAIGNEDRSALRRLLDGQRGRTDYPQPEYAG
jgi:hypothetical protein